MPTKPTLNPEQTQAFKSIKKFLEHPNVNTFVLKGYAGTGKTFLMQHLGKWLEENEKTFRMLATTGRAATVLRGKTGFTAKTVHSELYNFSKVEGVEDEGGPDYTGIQPVNKNGQTFMQFLTRIPDNEDDKVVYIVDEASMLSGQLTSESMFATFGSGVLLDDLFEVAGKNKIIFVGDPCQLPPVKQNFSPALDLEWLLQKQRDAITFTLQTIERTDLGNDILKLAQSVREMSQQPDIGRFPKLPASNLNNVKLYTSEKELFKAYQERYRQKGTNGTLAIARSNKTVQNINKAMRRDLFGSADLPLQRGDILLVTQNNYTVPLTNGDFVTIAELGEFIAKANLRFQKVKVKAVASELEYHILLSLDALHNIKGNLTDDEQSFLMIDFNKRMQNKNIKPNGEIYKKKMLEDEYLNCLRTTYGYAVTCHKAQGGEWNDVFLFLDKSMYGMKHPELCKWWYTSITRAKQELNLVKDWWIV
ncbi:ATP-dependent RecD-like DNA helicase [Mucilaginibacter terrae]|uniref:ATP-dependent DNA helicase n=1 Tax=Mucilaginibacter terrae TaxID=1955052 RepID=UPI00363D6129